jgi:hypothetical protein
LRVLTTGLAAATALAGATSCDDGSADEGAASSKVDYLAELAAACTVAGSALDDLPTPPEEISPDDFATEVASVLEQEADAVRRLRPPADLADDHRAFIRNTDDQARAWRDVAATVGTEPGAVNDLSTEILELSLGRDDLATEMGAEACRRDGS